MMIASKNSQKRLLHMPGCGYARRIRPEHQLRFDSFASGVRAGWHMCPHCSSAVAAFRRERTLLGGRCKQYGFKLWTEDGAIRICSKMDQWMVVPAWGKAPLKLLHKNTRSDESKSVIPGYHLQHIGADSIAGYLDYIQDHDGFRYAQAVRTHPLRGTKRWRRQQKAEQRAERRRQIRRTLELIEQLSLN